MCKENNLKLCLIWFGTYKNGASTYAPEYVKKNPEKYWPIYSTNGHVSATLSPLCKETCKRDREAFRKLLQRAKELDKDHIILGVQIENESGCLGPARDYSERGNKSYKEKVPEDMIKLVKSIKKPCPLTEFYTGKHGNWAETFGFYAPDIYMAYYFAKYINKVAEISKQLLDVPTYLNCWTHENGAKIPGVSYPSGGPTKNAIEIYKEFCKNIDMISADVYADNIDLFSAQALPYARKDNVFFLPESYPSLLQYPLIFRMIKDYQLTGVHGLGIDTLLDENGELVEKAKGWQQAINIMKSSKELLEENIGSENFIAVYQMYGEPFKVYELGGYIIQILFFNKNDPIIAHVDARHRGEKTNNLMPLGFIFKAKEADTFYITGQGFVARFTKKITVEQVTDSLLLDANHNKNAFHQYVSVEEGTYENGKYYPRRKRNGDEAEYGTWAADDTGVVRLKL